MLIADDDAAMRRVLERTLRRLGCEVLAASDGDQAFRVAVEAQPAVIFLDLKMPGRDGRALLRQLPAAGVLASVIVMSGHGDIDDAIDALRMGAVDYLRKPWEMKQLMSALGRGVDLYRLIESQPPVLPQPEPPSAEPDPDGPSAQAGPPGAPPKDDAPGAPIAPVEPHQSPAPRPTLPARSAAGPGRTASDGAAAPPRANPTAPLDPSWRADLDEQHRSGVLRLPPLPEVVARFRELARDPHASLTQLAGVVERDRPAATALLRLANSSFHARGQKISDVEAAVLAVGIPRVSALIETLALRACFPITEPVLGAVQERVWRFSVVRGLVMRTLAEWAGPESGLDGERDTLAALMLDAGALFLLWTLAERQRAAPPHPPRLSLAMVAGALATDGGRFTPLLLEQWGMSAELVRFVRTHPAEAWAPAEAPGHCAAILAGPLTARLVGFPDPVRALPPRPELLHHCAYLLQIGETRLRRATAALADDVRETWAILDV